MLQRISRALLPTQDPFAPHDGVLMEGYYTHLHVPSSLTLVVIFCEVKTALDADKRIMVYVLYAPHHATPNCDSGSTRFAREMCAPSWTIERTPSASRAIAEWSVSVPNIGTMRVSSSEQTWTVYMPGETSNEMLELYVRCTTRTPWSSDSPIAGPEGAFERLGSLLPLHWHVFSLCSQAEWRLVRRRPSPSNGPKIEVPVARGEAVAHVEKNHGVSFPRGWLWGHCVGLGSTTPTDPPLVRLAFAGGRILGIDAFLVGFRDDGRGIAWDFGPPLTVGIRGHGGGIRVDRCWDDGQGKRTVRVEVWNWGRWLTVEVVADAASFISLPGPLSTGFAPDMCHESFQATYTITLRTRRLWRWSEIARYRIEEGALEFGGEYARVDSVSQAPGKKAHRE